MVTNLPTDSVAADMDRIFKPLAARAGMVPAAALDGARKAGPDRRGWGRMVLVAPILLIVAGGTLAIGYVSQDALGPKTTARSTLTAMRQVVAEPATRVQTPVAITPAPQMDVMSPTVATAPLAADPDPARDVAPASRAGGAAIPSTTQRDDAVERSPSDLRTSLVLSDAPTRSAPLRSNRVAGSAPHDCVAGSLEDRCIYQDVLNADARLRLAYSRARRAGVSSQQLAAINRRWTRARDQADDDPDGTIERYDQLSDALDRARERYE